MPPFPTIAFRTSDDSIAYKNVSRVLFVIMSAASAAPDADNPPWPIECRRSFAITAIIMQAKYENTIANPTVRWDQSELDALQYRNE